MNWTVAIGIDTHRDIHVAFALDRMGRELGSLEVETTQEGSEKLLAFASSLGEPAFVIEGTGSYGAGLTRFLVEAGCEVYECERPRRRSRRQSKSDLIDARKAGARLVAGERIAFPRSFGKREQLKALLSERRACVQACTQAKNSLRALLVTAPEPLRRELRQLTAERLVSACLELEAAGYAGCLVRISERIGHLKEELRQIDRELEHLTRSLSPRLLEELGVGPVVAAQIIVSAGDASRIRSEAAFAALAGTSPVEASSGLVKRHRLNRGGDRQLNWAMHTACLVRIRFHEETRSYYERLLERGKTKREAIRCVKRMFCRRLYRVLVEERSLCGT
ncbi:MAG: IS110 family transposase [Acidobacteria bacterium]|nr:IS110 family transposase [Acidobacteriota bacterium]